MKIMKKVFLCIFACIANFTLDARYKACPIVKGNCSQKSNKQNYVAWDYKIFKPKDCKKYLNCKGLIKKGFQPIQITLTNHSKQSLVLSLDRFSFSTISAEQVALSLHRNGAARGVGFGIPGALCCWPLIIPAVVQGCGANDYNDAMDNDFIYKALVDQIVPPFETVCGIIFIPKEEFVKKHFSLTLELEDVKKSVELSTKQSVACW